MPSWKDFKRLTTPEQWARITQYMEDAQEDTELSDYPSVRSWREMGWVLTQYETNQSVHAMYFGLIDDYKKYCEAQ